MQWWQIMLTITGINGGSFILFVWWLRGWFEITKKNKDDIDDLLDRTKINEQKQIDTDMTIKDINHSIDLLRKDTTHSLENINEATATILQSLNQKFEDDRVYRLEQEGGRKRTQSTLEAISRNMESQCNLATAAIKSATK